MQRLSRGAEEEVGNSLMQRVESITFQPGMLPKKVWSLLGAQSLDIMERRLRLTQTSDGSPAVLPCGHQKYVQERLKVYQPGLHGFEREGLGQGSQVLSPQYCQ